MATTKASGVNIPEAQRGTERLNLRLDPETMTDIRDMAAECGCSVAQVIESAMMALYRAKMDLADAKGKDVYAEFVERCESDG